MILAVTGLERERRILTGSAAGQGIEVIVGGGDAARLEREVDRAAGHASGIISIGIAGALAPQLKPGAWVVADAVRGVDLAMPTDQAWRERLLARLPGAMQGLVLGGEAIVAIAAEKADLHRTTGAIAVDMETHVAARVAARYRLPLAVARVISDAADRTLPPAARVGMRPDGGIDLPAVLRSLLADPLQLPALIRTGLEAERGFRALLRGHRRLGSHLGGPDLGELPVDVV
ncbi:MAG: hopanoid-associated phosphorylase [Alphaproteobacteria bacterium 65-37]|nr:MAG: hopanoid-associated phosphorylase [Alphaproteobacteria bacterium 65-37]